MRKYSQISKQTIAGESLNIEDPSEDRRFVAFGEGFMNGFDGLPGDFNPYTPAFDYPLVSWYKKGYAVGALYAKGKQVDIDV